MTFPRVRLDKELDEVDEDDVSTWLRRRYEDDQRKRKDNENSALRPSPVPS